MALATSGAFHLALLERIGVNGLVANLRSLGSTRLLVMGALALSLLGSLVFFSGRLAQPQMALLFGELELRDSARIIARLEQLKVPFELRGQGAEIMVPADQVTRLRMAAAAEGLPGRGSVGYELFDRTEALGSTSFVQNLNHVRALEGELARTIQSIEHIAAARVHLVLPRRELFTRETREPSAAIALRMVGNSRLSPAQIRAVQNLVASAVPDLKPGRVSLVDDRGTMLSRGAGADDPGAGLVEVRQAFESKLKNAVETLLEQSLGAGRVRAEVAAEMNFDRTTTNAEVFDPEGRVERSTQSVTENTASREAEPQAGVSVTNNLPEAQAKDANGAKSSNQSTRQEETVNYEISKTIRTQVLENGTVKRVSVALLVDGTYRVENGAKNYQPRAKEELEQITALVKTAIGFNEQRGDKVEVVNLRFVRPDDEPFEAADTPLLSLGKADYMRIGEILGFIVVAALTLLFVVRPVLARALAEAAPAGQLALAGPDGRTPLQHSPAGGGQAALPGPQEAEDEEEAGISEALRQLTSGSPPALIDLEKIEGRVKASTIKKLGELVDKHPEEAVSIMRAWMAPAT